MTKRGTPLWGPLSAASDNSRGSQSSLCAAQELHVAHLSPLRRVRAARVRDGAQLRPSKSTRKAAALLRAPFAASCFRRTRPPSARTSPAHLQSRESTTCSLCGPQVSAPSPPAARRSTSTSSAWTSDSASRLSARDGAPGLMLPRHASALYSGFLSSRSLTCAVPHARPLAPSAGSARSSSRLQSSAALSSRSATLRSSATPRAGDSSYPTRSPSSERVVRHSASLSVFALLAPLLQSEFSRTFHSFCVMPIPQAESRSSAAAPGRRVTCARPQTLRIWGRCSASQQACDCELVR